MVQRTTRETTVAAIEGVSHMFHDFHQSGIGPMNHHFTITIRADETTGDHAAE